MLPTILRGARTNNLRGVSVDVRPGEVVAVTGVSGSGKSSLVIDTLYAEGQRRFVESFSPYARQFLERLERPPMDGLDPVPAAIAVDRRAPVKSSRSTVATMSDVEPYLSALFTREAIPFCPEHAQAAVHVDARVAAERALHEAREVGAGGLTLTYPMRLEAEATTESYLSVRETLLGDGYRRVLHDAKLLDLDQLAPTRALASGVLDVVVDRWGAGGADLARASASIEQAWGRGMGLAHWHARGARGSLRSGLCCPECARPFAPPFSGLFSYESPLGACATCRGFGRIIGIDLDKVVPDDGKTLAGGAVRPWSGKTSAWERRQLAKLCERRGVPMDVAWRDLDADQRNVVLDGDGTWRGGKFPGVRGWFKWLETRTYRMHVRVFLARYRSYDPCPDCEGRRLSEHALQYRVAGKNLAEWHAMEVRHAVPALGNLRPTTGQGDLARRELASRLGYLDRVGLGYLTLDRQARTLSGGEAQRVTLTAALGTSLHNALFVLDEPTVGLHPADVPPLVEMMRELAARGSAVLVVEHDPAIIAGADRVIELGPGAGAAGGSVVFDGSAASAATAGGATARALASLDAEVGSRRVRPPTGSLGVRGARAHNLRDVSVQIPLGVLCAVTGPSGSGKSTLVVDVVYRALARLRGDLDVERPGEHDGIDGAGAVSRVGLVDQSPLGRTSRGNAATYTKAWDAIRKLYASEPMARAAGLRAKHFSFNVDGGRCEACTGEGWETVEMQFLADVRLLCPVCRGKRFKPEVLRVTRRGTTIAELLDRTIDDVLGLFHDQTAVLRALGPVARLGLGYLRLGQPLTTLSGGEAQRLKIARALADRHEGALLILDEPSAGLHVDEVRRVVEALEVIVEGGGSVVVVEHDLDVVRAADWVIDLGPDAGAGGGSVVAQGPPSVVARAATRTGRALRGDRAAAPASTRKGRPRGSARPRDEAPPALTVTRAREHNLEDVSVAIPHGALTVVTGPSGSGKSTLAFDVVFAEGQRRFLETLTPYARQFLPTMPRPDVDSVQGVPPSIALEQRSTRAGPRSTVATVTEVAHYLRLLYAKLGTPHCPVHDAPIGTTSADDLHARLVSRTGRFDLLAPVVRARKGTYLDVFDAAARDGIERAYCDGALVETDDPPRLARSREHDIDLVLAAGTTGEALDRARFDRALGWGRGSIIVRAGGVAELHSLESACPTCGLSVPVLDPRWFSFNTAQGRCATCEGAGLVEAPKRRRRRRRRRSAKPPPEPAQAPGTCAACGGTRLAPIPRGVRFQGESYPGFVARSVASALRAMRRWKLTGDAARVGVPVLRELLRRLQFLEDVGLDYLSLDRAAATLSGGEMQRLRLAAQLGAGLTGALYVLDEPTIGLHPKDTGRLLQNLRALVDLGSSVVVVEHDADTIRAADFLVDLGPGGGSRGGNIVAAGAPNAVLSDEASPTGRALAAPTPPRRAFPVPARHPRLQLLGASAHNLRAVDLEIPIGRLTVVAGVSGSGKSTLVRHVLLPAVRQELGLAADTPGAFRSLGPLLGVARAVAVDQSPIGRTPRSVPATFLGIWDLVRRLLAATPEAKVAGFDASRFSFNTQGGRCETCTGQGVITHEMSFLPDVVTACSACRGTRFEPRTLSISHRGRSVGDLLAMTAEEAADVFANHPKIASPLRTLSDLGAGYVTLGQGSHTLSGGEAQRLKLAAELTASARHEPTLYVLDEPTTGLHLADVSKLMDVLGRLVERGDTLVVIEHHPQVIAGADWVVELGPGAGEAGGRIVASGPPGAVARKKTATGEVLRSLGVLAG